MKILILSDANSVHTFKWVESLSKHNISLILFSLFTPNNDYKKKYRQLNVEIHSPNLRSRISNLKQPNLTKLYYLNGLKHLKKIIRNYKPDLIHAHYASSYGVLAFLSFFRPFIISVWGSDIYLFPKINFINKWILKKVIQSADKVCSTSNAMKKIIIEEYDRSDIHIIPFGVNINLFSPSLNSTKDFIVGTIKSIEDYNGIDCLLDSAAIIINKYKHYDIKFLIVGKGSLLDLMKGKARQLDIEKNVEFAGKISFDNIVKYHQKLSVFVAVSTRESFGVSILESLACGIPAITSNIGGLPEVNKNQHTGIIIDPNDPEKLADSIIKLYLNENYRNKLSKNARDWVVKNFNWEENVNQMINIYKQY